MTELRIPTQLESLLSGSKYKTPIYDFAERTSTILKDNKTIFFPNYTDHGIEHINNVLNSEVELIPKPIWESCKENSKNKPINDADAAIIIGATLLHDIAMHIHEEGFIDLIKTDSRFKPIQWFNESQEGHTKDLPWNELWNNYCREARRFSEQDLSNIIGEQESTNWKFKEIPSDKGKWTTNDKLIIGEFLRRHHARIAHEIAIYGFPGLPPGDGMNQFPAIGIDLGHRLNALADLIGLVARSHGTSLRLCKTYLESHPIYGGALRPMQSAVLFPMALLRVADYLQIDCERAPTILLMLRNPQSPASLKEWEKHKAVMNITDDNDTRAKRIIVGDKISLSTYLQIKELLTNLQAEIDHSTAVLDEAYGCRSKEGLDQLNLAIRRINSNIHDQSYLKRLPYIPQSTGFSADPKVLTLLVDPLYGKKPSVGIRELLQNAIDAIRELEHWCKINNKTKNELQLPKIEGDIVIEFLEQNSNWTLRIQDCGIGMTSDIIQNYFLRAGASFKTSQEWSQKYTDEAGEPKIIRSGRFGIGAFSLFLLGDSFKLTTRHASAPEDEGLSIEANHQSALIEIKTKTKTPIGTIIEIKLNEHAKKTLVSNKISVIFNTNWYRLSAPTIIYKINGATLKNPGIKKINFNDAHWFKIETPDFPENYWTYEDSPSLLCNGIVIIEPDYLNSSMSNFEWNLTKSGIMAPKIAITDIYSKLPITIQRYKLTDKIPFTKEIEDHIYRSIIAHALVLGAKTQCDVAAINHPLTRNIIELNHKPGETTPFTWIATPTGYIIADGWSFDVIKNTHFYAAGSLMLNEKPSKETNLISEIQKNTSNQAPFCVINFTPSLHNLHETFSREIMLLSQTISSNKLLDAEIISASIKTKTDIIPIKNEKPICLEINNTLENINFCETKDAWNKPEAIYMAKLKRPKTTYHQRFSEIWIKCIGEMEIPFCPEKRHEIIKKASLLPEMKTYIDSWKKTLNKNPF